MQAVIFDMDGLLIDSEPMWQQAEKMVFSALGVDVNTHDTIQTASMTPAKVTEFWFKKSPWVGHSLKSVENAVVDHVCQEIKTSGKAMPGVYALLASLKENSIKIGLATNAPRPVLSTVLTALNITEFFATTTSADEVVSGKPSPAIYQQTLAKLHCTASNAIAIEDSATGMQAAHNAGLKCVVVPAPQAFNQPDFDVAALKLKSLTQLSYPRLTQLVRNNP